MTQPLKDFAGGNYRSFVGAPDKYDIIGAQQFNILVDLGLREHHKLLDIGCGSLRGGRLFMPYLLPGNYYGIEPVPGLIKEGILNELGEDIIKVKQPKFDDNQDFDLGIFGVNFDFILAQSIFTHASQKQIDLCFREAAKAMRKESVFIFSYLRSAEVDCKVENIIYPAASHYTMDFFTKMAHKNGMGIKFLDYYKHPNGLKWAKVINASI